MQLFSGEVGRLGHERALLWTTLGRSCGPGRVEASQLGTALGVGRAICRIIGGLAAPCHDLILPLPAATRKDSVVEVRINMMGFNTSKLHRFATSRACGERDASRLLPAWKIIVDRIFPFSDDHVCPLNEMGCRSPSIGRSRPALTHL